MNLWVDLSDPMQPVVTLLSPRANANGTVIAIESSADRPDTIIFGFSAAPSYRLRAAFFINPSFT
jgi:hypothetical protein